MPGTVVPIVGRWRDGSKMNIRPSQTNDRTEPGFRTCPFCGRIHQAIRLRRGERAFCIDCGTPLQDLVARSRSALALTVTALILAVPALELPLVTVQKFGAEHSSYVWTGIKALWQDGMPLMSVWVALCGIAVPLALLATLVMLVTSNRTAQSSKEVRLWMRLATAFQHWSMPEVQVLAVLVAFVKIGALVHVEPGTGLWFYAAMTLAMLFAWHTADLDAQP